MSERATTGAETPPEGWRPGLVALDIDGTLVDRENTISPAVERAVRAVLEAGSHVVLATGRGLTSTMPVAQRLCLPKPYLVCSNGAVTSWARTRPPASATGTSSAGVGTTADITASMASATETTPGISLPGRGASRRVRSR